MKRVITYGTYDLFHEGHLNLLKRAKALGDYLIVGVTTDNFDLERGKLNVCNNVMERIEAVRKTGLADQIIIEEYVGQKIDDILKYHVDIFAIGSDWVGKFDYLKEFCEVIYLPRTEGISSTILREENNKCVNIGIIGTGSIAKRFAVEAQYVSSTNIGFVYNPNTMECERFGKEFNILACNSYKQLLDNSDAVYIASPPHTHYEYAKGALIAKKHVICETPFVLSTTQAEELYQLAEKNKLILMVALKTAFCPAFNHLISLLKSGVIGDIISIDASVTNLTDENSPKLLYGSMNENASFTLLPIFKLFGTDYKKIEFYSKFKNNFDIYTKGIIQYSTAIASFQVGLGVKSEGNLVISGTKGYIYVPAPWWKTDYFEVRYEDQNKNKKYFYTYEGEGLRYEIKEFISSILNASISYTKLSKKEIITIVKIHEVFLNDSHIVNIIY